MTIYAITNLADNSLTIDETGQLHSPLGSMRPVASAAGLVRLDWQQKPFTDRAENVTSLGTKIEIEACAQLKAYLTGRLTRFDLPFDWRGHSQAMKRWFEVITIIPYGELWTYSQLAKIWGNEKAARPAGQACRRNPIPIIIPCHRVVSADGGPNQYSGGSETTPTNPGNLERKLWLQSLEAHNQEG